MFGGKFKFSDVPVYLSDLVSYILHIDLEQILHFSMFSDTLSRFSGGDPNQLRWIFVLTQYFVPKSNYFDEYQSKIKANNAKKLNILDSGQFPNTLK